MFSLEGPKLTYTPRALRAIAEKALKRATGARALRAVMEEVMLDMMYELPDQPNEGTEYVVDEADVIAPPPADGAPREGEGIGGGKRRFDTDEFSKRAQARFFIACECRRRCRS